MHSQTRWLGALTPPLLSFFHVAFQSKVAYEVKAQPERRHQVPLALEMGDRGHLGLGCLLAQSGSQPTFFFNKNELFCQLTFRFSCVSLCDTNKVIFSHSVECSLCSVQPRLPLFVSCSYSILPLPRSQYFSTQLCLS